MAKYGKKKEEEDGFIYIDEDGTTSREEDGVVDLTDTIPRETLVYPSAPVDGIVEGLSGKVDGLSNDVEKAVASVNGIGSELKSDYAKAVDIAVSSLEGVIKSGIETGHVDAESINADSGRIGRATADTLTAEKVNADEVVSGKVNADTVEAAQGIYGSLSAEVISVPALDTGSISGTDITAEDIKATKASIDQVMMLLGQADKIKAWNVEADSISGTKHDVIGTPSNDNLLKITVRTWENEGVLAMKGVGNVYILAGGLVFWSMRTTYQFSPYSYSIWNITATKVEDSEYDNDYVYDIYFACDSDDSSKFIDDYYFLTIGAERTKDDGSVVSSEYVPRANIGNNINEAVGIKFVQPLHVDEAFVRKLHVTESEDVTGNLTVTGNAGFIGTVSVDGKEVINGTLDVSEDITSPKAHLDEIWGRLYGTADRTRNGITIYASGEEFFFDGYDAVYFDSSYYIGRDGDYITLTDAYDHIKKVIPHYAEEADKLRHRLKLFAGRREWEFWGDENVDVDTQYDFTNPKAILRLRDHYDNLQDLVVQYANNAGALNKTLYLDIDGKETTFIGTEDVRVRIGYKLEADKGKVILYDSNGNRQEIPVPYASESGYATNAGGIDGKNIKTDEWGSIIKVGDNPVWKVNDRLVVNMDTGLVSVRGDIVADGSITAKGGFWGRLYGKATSAEQADSSTRVSNPLIIGSRKSQDNAWNYDGSEEVTVRTSLDTEPSFHPIEELYNAIGGIKDVQVYKQGFACLNQNNNIFVYLLSSTAQGAYIVGVKDENIPPTLRSFMGFSTGDDTGLYRKVLPLSNVFISSYLYSMVIVPGTQFEETRSHVINDITKIEENSDSKVARTFSTPYTTPTNPTLPSDAASFTYWKNGVIPRGIDGDGSDGYYMDLTTPVEYPFIRGLTDYQKYNFELFHYVDGIIWNAYNVRDYPDHSVGNRVTVAVLGNTRARDVGSGWVRSILDTSFYTDYDYHYIYKTTYNSEDVEMTQLCKYREGDYIHGLEGDNDLYLLENDGDVYRWDTSTYIYTKIGKVSPYGKHFYILRDGKILVDYTSSTSSVPDGYYGNFELLDTITGRVTKFTSQHIYGNRVYVWNGIPYALIDGKLCTISFSSTVNYRINDYRDSVTVGGVATSLELNNVKWDGNVPRDLGSLYSAENRNINLENIIA